jgi:hypothetical protein
LKQDLDFGSEFIVEMKNISAKYFGQQESLLKGLDRITIGVEEETSGISLT